LELEKKWHAEVAFGEIAGEKAILCKPQTYMNLSGKAVGAVAQFYKVPIEKVSVFMDDADLPFGDTRFRVKGSAGGHNGLKSIIQSLGSNQFSRLKLGIKNDHHAGKKAMEFVLQKFSEEESEQLPAVSKAAIDKFLTTL
jgi:PTH1 family peptidyl-tRNA hydrolase